LTTPIYYLDKSQASDGARHEGQEARGALAISLAMSRAAAAAQVLKIMKHVHDDEIVRTGALELWSPGVTPGPGVRITACAFQRKTKCPLPPGIWMA
jgi:hypothetical protein